MKNKEFLLKIIGKGALFEWFEGRETNKLHGCQITNGLSFDGILWVSDIIPNRGEILSQYQLIYSQGYPCLSFFELENSLIASYQKTDQGACPKCCLKRMQDNTSVPFVANLNEKSKILHQYPNLELAIQLCLVPLVKRMVEPEPHPSLPAREFILASGACREIPVFKDAFCDICGNSQNTVPDKSTTNPVKLDPTSFRTKKTPSENTLFQTLYDSKFGLVNATSIEIWHKYTLPVITFFGKNGFAGGHAFKLKESMALGFLESLERYSGFRRRTPIKRVLSNYNALKGAKINPGTLGLLALPDHPANAEFTPFHRDLEMWWIEGFSYRDHDPVWIPECMVYYDPAGIDDLRLTPETSNGCALGGHPDEALFYGLLELIERDAFSIMWYHQLPLQRIDPSTIDDEMFQFLLDKVHLENCSVFLFNMSLDIAIPVLLCICMRNDEQLGAVTLGASAYPCPLKAARSALIEATYFLSDFKNRTIAMEDNLEEMALDFGQVKDLSHHSYLYALPKMKHHLDFLTQRPMNTFQEIAPRWIKFPNTEDLTEDLEFVVGVLEQQGFNVFGVSQNCLELKPFGLHSYRAIVPGLVPISFGFHQRKGLSLARVSEVPIKLGVPGRSIEQLNTVPHPFP